MGDSERNGWDVIVVGAGTAGIPCAIAAGEGGARVLVVEGSDRIGGTLHVTGGHMSAGGTRRQRERGIDDSPQSHFDDIRRVSHDTADHEVVRVAVEEAPHTIDWLEDLGFPFDPETPALVYGHEPYAQPRTYWAADAGKDILRTIQPRFEELQAEGRITLLLRHRLVDLLVEDGAVAGVRVETPDGERELHGAAVVLACGGYASNPEFYSEVTPGNPRLVSVAPETSRGDGIFAAQRAGAAFRYADKNLPTAFGIERPPGSGRSDFWGERPNLVPANRPPREIYVNEQGERFLNEDDQSPDRRERVIMELPDNRWWMVFDDASIDAGEPLVVQWGADELRRQASEGVVAWVADDVRELASKAGIDPDGLERTVAEWNEAVRSGEDPVGRAEPAYSVSHAPYYAVLNRATTFISFGGLAIDSELRVVDEAGRPIPNLYAAGEIVGAGATSGNAFCGGMMVTPAISFGRILGRRLAAVEAAAR